MQILPIKEVCRRVGLSRTKVWQMTKQRTFPQPVNLTGAKRKGYVASEVDQWIRERIAERDGEAS